MRLKRLIVKLPSGCAAAVADPGRVTKRHEAGQEEELLLHRAYLPATGAQSREKCGLRSSARANHVLASARWPRQRSIIPRWKNFSESSVPRRSARFEYPSASPQLTGARERPGEHVVAVDRRPLALREPRERERRLRPDPVVDVEERRLEIGLHAVRAQETLDHRDRRVLPARVGCPPPAAIHVPERSDELRQRDQVHAPAARARPPHRAGRAPPRPAPARRRRTGSAETRSASRGTDAAPRPACPRDQ